MNLKRTENKMFRERQIYERKIKNFRKEKVGIKYRKEKNKEKKIFSLEREKILPC